MAGAGRNHRFTQMNTDGREDRSLNQQQITTNQELPNSMLTSDFDYELPEALIAQEPLAQRSAARMMVLHRQTQQIEHRHVLDLPTYLGRDDLLVMNDTRVLPARLFGEKQGTGGKVELLFLEECEPDVWLALCRASRRPAVGSLLELADGALRCTTLAIAEQGRIRVRPEGGSARLIEVWTQCGTLPLPPYIKRGPRVSRQADAVDDRERYQTVYARETGAVAAPTAGLHFDETLLGRLDERGVTRTCLTLHVGIGTFRPVSVDRVEEHRMDAERYVVTSNAAECINTTRERGGRVVAVGSTTVRTLETVADPESGRIMAGEGRSSIFITPPYEFRAVDAMLTNFHLPKSTLLMMVSALAGREFVLEAYRQAVAAEYRFFSYGDCMLIL